MEGKKTTQEEYQKCVNAVVDYINLHLGEEIDLKSLARISHFSPFYFHRIMKAFLGEKKESTCPMLLNANKNATSQFLLCLCFVKRYWLY